MSAQTKASELASQLVSAAKVQGKDQVSVALEECVGTHDGHFHCDEAFACGMLQLTSEMAGRNIVRTRDSDTLDKCKIVVDVGGVFDAEKKRFDHHQRGFEETFSEDFKTKLSSAGLVYKYFGREIIAKIAELYNVQLSQDMNEMLFQKAYKNFVEHIDGIDNGIEAYTGEKNYSVSTHLSARVGSLNPAWNEEQSTEAEMSNFSRAMHLTLSEFVDHVASMMTVWLPAREIVERAAKSRSQVDSSGEILCIERPCPWKSHLFALEEEGFDGLSKGQIKYVLYPDSSGKWRIQCVPVDEVSFTNRLSMPEKYRGVRDQALSDAWGIPGCIFVHASGFIGGNETFEGVLEMARKSLKGE